MRRKERIKELETASENQEDAVQELTNGRDGENEGETYKTGRNDKEIYHCMLHLTPRISKINVHSSLRLCKLDDRRG